MIDETENVYQDNYIIRKAVLEDIDALVALRREHFDFEVNELHNYTLDDGYFVRDIAKEDIKYFITKAITLVAVKDGKIVGYILGEIEPKRSWLKEQYAEIISIFVSKEHRNNKVATRLLYSFRDELIKNHNIFNIQVETLSNNEIAKKFYEKEKFNEISKKYYFNI